MKSKTKKGNTKDGDGSQLKKSLLGILSAAVVKVTIDVVEALIDNHKNKRKL